MKQDHAFGCLPSPYDSRDALYRLTFDAAPRPPEVDLRPLCSPISNQLNLGACTGFAIADGLREFLYIKGQSDAMNFSPLWLYQQELIAMDKFGVDAGAYIRTGMKVISKLGCVPEEFWPYDVGKFGVMPPATLEAEAAPYKVTTYHRLWNSSEVKACLAEGYACVFGFHVRKSFISIRSDGMMPMPKCWEASLGWHAVMVVGYNDYIKRYYIRNSWDDGWGHKGYFYMPYEYLTMLNVQDIWTAR